MARLILTELFKVHTTRVGWGMLLLTLAFVVCPPAFIIPAAGSGGAQGLPPLSDPEMVRTLYGSATSGITFVLMLGILGMTGEYRHRSLSQVFLQTPRRGRVLLAKIVAYAVLGTLFGIASVVLVVAVTVPAMGVMGGPVSIAVYDVPAILGGAVLASTLFAPIGLGVGALIRNQVAAIALALGWLWLTEIIIFATFPAAGKWLPGGALQALVGGNAGLTVVEVPDLLPFAGGALLLLGYGVLFTVAAVVITTRRDVT